ncbi:hypothetical protein [Aquimarina algiphila]|uniref:hypothetical protein n=1 Tax=Aquimarina algiphila TaxID=2047982 RepID=UPI002330C0F1|nr:hypothetical protein [Aquimarina algiphila]
MKLTMTRFHFSTSKVVSKHLSAKDNISNYTTIILIGAMTLLLGIYSFVAYSFLTTSSSLLIEDYSFLPTTITSQNKQTNQFFSHHKVTINDNVLINNEGIDSLPISTFLKNHLKQTLKDHPLQRSRSMLCISETIIETGFSESFQKNNKTVS